GCELISPVEPIVIAARFRIADDLVSGIDFTYLFFRLLTVGIAGGVVFEDQLPVGLLDDVVRRLTRDAQDAVKIHARHGRDYITAILGGSPWLPVLTLVTSPLN